jgi:hypothetical protein
MAYPQVQGRAGPFELLQGFHFPKNWFIHRINPIRDGIGNGMPLYITGGSVAECLADISGS